MTHLDYHSPQHNLGFRNQKTGLLIFGIVLILMGLAAGCMTVMMPVGLYFQATVPVPTTGPGAVAPPYPVDAMTLRNLVAAMVLYLALTVGFIWTGIGSILARRWVRPIVIIFGTLWLVMGIIGTIAMLISLPAMQANMQAQAARSGAGATPPFWIIAIFIVLFMMLIYLVIPAVFVWYYRRVDVLRTMEYFDPRPRWTDACPLPVLGMSITCALFAFMILSGMASGVVPVFGIVLTGPAAAAVLVLEAAVFGGAAVLIYRRRMAGWNIAVAMLLLIQISMVISVLLVDMRSVFVAMGAGEANIELAMGSAFARPAVVTMFSVLFTLLALAYAVRVRRYLKIGSSESPAAPG